MKTKSPGYSFLGSFLILCAMSVFCSLNQETDFKSEKIKLNQKSEKGRMCDYLCILYDFPSFNMWMCVLPIPVSE